MRGKVGGNLVFLFFWFSGAFFGFAAARWLLDFPINGPGQPKTRHGEKTWYSPRFVRVILAQGPC